MYVQLAYTTNAELLALRTGPLLYTVDGKRTDVPVRMQQLDRAALSLLMLSLAIGPQIVIQLGHFDHMLICFFETTRVVGSG